MFKRGLFIAAVVTVGLVSNSVAGHSTPRVDSQTRGNTKMGVHYLEVVSDDADALTGLYQRMYGLSFGPADADLGQARVATQADGSLVGIRKPLAAHEHAIVRTYVAVEDIQKAVKKAAEVGATVAYPPTLQGKRGTFAIVIQGGVEHGLWQR